MKKTCRFVLFAIAVLLLTASLSTSAFAAEIESPQLLKFDDGSYIVVTIEYDQAQNGTSYFVGESVTSGTKNYTAYSSSDKALWEFRVHGTFSYNSVTALATQASYSYDIYDSSWSFVNGSTSCSGATATATGTFKHLLFPNTVTLALTCSLNGVLS